MKDYIQDIPSMYISKEARKRIASEFILKYKITNDPNPQIIVYYADGKKITYDYSKELEQSLLLNMKENFQKYVELFQKNYHDHISQEALCDACMVGGACIMAVPLVQTLFSSIVKEPSPPIPFITLGGAVISYSLFDKIMYMKRYQDFAKTLLYLQNENDINFHLGYNLNFVNNTMSKKQHNYLVTKPDGKKGYTINSIDKMSLAELKKLLNVIERENDFMRLFPVLYDDTELDYIETEKRNAEICKKRLKQQ